MPTTDVVDDDLARVHALDDDLAGIDALDTPLVPRVGLGRRIWSAAWPKLLAVALGLGIWQAVVWSGWKPSYALPGPVTTFEALADLVTTQRFWTAVCITLQRAALGYSISLVLGTLLGLAVARSRILRAGVGSLITGFQSMPSIAWFPLAILLFQLSEQAILFVVVLGATPSIANGVVGGVDHVPPVLLRAGRVLGARGITFWRAVVLPAAMPGYVAGLKQGWAFAWRSLMAGELIVIIASRPSVGAGLQFARDLSDAPLLLSWMIVVLVIGILVDVCAFGTIERIVRTRRGLGGMPA